MAPSAQASAIQVDSRAAAPSISPRTASAVWLTGWLLAKGRSHPGMVATGTKIADAKVRGKMKGNVIAWAASEFGAARPTKAKPHDRQYAKTNIKQARLQVGDDAAARAKADEKAHAGDDDQHQHVAKEVRDGATGEDRESRHGQRTEALDETLLEVFGEPDRRSHRAEDHGLDQDAGNQVVDVRTRPGISISPPNT